VYAVYGADSAGVDYGKNIFISYNKRPKDYGNSTTQGIKTELITASIRGAYILDTKMNLKIELGFAARMERTEKKTVQTPFVFIGIRMDLSNLYNDF
jgi:maltoporin